MNEQKPRRRPSAVEPRFSEMIEGLEQKLSEIATSIEGSRELWEEWDAHVENWRFSPEQFTAELISAALIDEIRTYVDANKPAEHWPGSQFVMTDEWRAGYWSWLLSQPIAARMLRESVSTGTCFLGKIEGIREAYTANVREYCIQHIQQRMHEPHTVLDDSEKGAAT